MSLIPEVKCRRCGETFSSLRRTCPSCGTRVVSQSTRTPGTTPGTVKGTAAYDRAATNTKWQMIFGLILVVAVILAVIVMVSTSLNGGDGTGTNKNPKTTPAAETDSMPTPEAPPTPTPSPTPAVQKIELHSSWNTKPWDNNEFTLHSTEEAVTVIADVYPLDIQNPVVTWSVEDESIITVTPDPENPKACKVAYAGNGHGKLICTVFGQTKELTIYCVD